MLLRRALNILLLVAPILAQASSPSKFPAKRSYSTHDYYVLELHPSAGESLPDCAAALGVQIVEQVGELAHHWLVRMPSTDFSKRTLDDSSSPSNHDPVLERLDSLRRSASSHPSHIQARDSSPRLSKAIRSVERQIPKQRTKKRAPILPEPYSERAPIEPLTKSEIIAQKLGIHDPIFNDQWHLANNPHPQYDLNISGVWAQGVTGKGVYAAVVDDGLDAESDDLAANFYKEGSYDFNDHTNLPLPKLSDDQHGTRCSGEIAAVKNDVCGVGVAYESKIAGIRILSGAITDADEAASLNYGYNVTSIYSCSWGPPDDGRSMEAPSRLIQKAVVNGIQNGRGGKGSIYVFASGNGAASGDQCNFDGYTNSIYSLTVAAVDHLGGHPYYSEACAANLIVAYSSGGGNRIFTTDVGKNKCTNAHGGTSAAAPLAAGVVALGLQVRPELTWRDVQYVALRSAMQINPDDDDWEMTASGRPYSYKYGYGALDAWTFVELARTWPLVKPQAWVDLPQVEMPDSAIDTNGVMTGGVPIPEGGIESSLHVSPEVLRDNNFAVLEHITVKVWIQHGKRGDVEVEILSPKGVRSVLAGARKYDNHNTGFPGWQFMSVKHWGENPTGDWKLRVKDQADPLNNGSFLGWSLTLWGECEDPSKAKLWTFPVEPAEDGTPDDASPTESTSIVEPTSTEAAPSKTTRPTKPTDHLPDDHDIAQGDSSKPAFPNPGPADPVTVTSAATPDSTSASTPSAKPTPSYTPDEGVFAGMGNLLQNQTWLFIAIGFVVLFAVATGIFFWQRRQRRASYSAVAGDVDELAMGAVDGSSRRLLGRKGRKAGAKSKELYDAFGEPEDDSDEDEYADASEGDRLVHRGVAGETLPDAGLHYHDEFLEDDGVDSRQHSPAGGYRDEPLPGPSRSGGGGGPGPSNLRAEETSGSRSPSGGSGDSWEHADAGR